MDGVEGLGIPRNEDYNGVSQEGVGYFQRFIFKGRRHNSANAFLKPALKSGKIDLRREALSLHAFNFHRVLFACILHPVGLGLTNSCNLQEKICGTQRLHSPRTHAQYHQGLLSPVAPETSLSTDFLGRFTFASLN